MAVMAGMCFSLFTTLRVEAAPLYGFDSDGNMAIVGEVDDLGNEILYPEEGENDGTVDDLQDVSEDILANEILPQEAPLSEIPSFYDAGDIPMVSYAADAAAVSSDFNPSSCLQYQATIAGYSGVLMIPTSYKESVYIDDNGVLWNVGSSSIVGRLLLSRSMNSGDYKQYIVTVQSCLTNTASSVYRNGSLSYVTRYYLSGTSISNSAYYGDVVVSDDMSTYSKDASFQTNLYLLIIIFVLLGGGMICFSKHSRN